MLMLLRTLFGVCVNPVVEREREREGGGGGEATWLKTFEKEK